MFEGFAEHELPTDRGPIHALVGGSGPPVLLLHGYPQTHVMWRDCAPALTDRFTVVAADLPGYGGSFRPVPAPDHEPHSKRALARDLVQAMAALGHEWFAVAGHDRGGRVAYRMAIDHPDRIAAAAVFDVVPTGEVWARTDAQLALLYWHWAFLAQPAPLPERLIGADPGAFFDLHVRRLGVGGAAGRYPDDADAGRAAITCPVLALWSARGALPRLYGDVLEVWRAWAPDVSGYGLDASHFLVEDEPERVAAELVEFCGGAA